MTSPGPRQPNARVRLMAWLRGQSWVRGAYRTLPAPVREGALRLLTRRLQGQTRFPRTTAWEAQRGVPDALVPLEALSVPVPSGVNIVGYIHGQFGLAEAARCYARALIQHGVPVAMLDVDLGLPHASGEHAFDAYLDDTAPHPVSIIFINPDFLEQALAAIGKARLQGKHLIACWFWELERIPDSWLPALALVDEVLVATAFVENAVKRVTHKPVLRVPMPLGALPSSGLQRSDFGLPDNTFVFLVSFDFSSLMERKNPDAALRAFRAAFPVERTDVRLLIKSSNGYRFPHLLQHLSMLAEGDDRILIRDEVIEREHLNALHHCCDAYVSLHRAEGFGMGMAESMAIGKPVIATGWSGNMEFMDDHCAALVGYTLVPVKEGDYPGGQGQRWADPDIQQAARWMRRLADDPGMATELGRRGRDHVERVLSGRTAAEQIATRAVVIESTEQVQDGCNRD